MWFCLRLAAPPAQGMDVRSRQRRFAEAASRPEAESTSIINESVFQFAFLPGENIDTGEGSSEKYSESFFLDSLPGAFLSSMYCASCVS